MANSSISDSMSKFMIATATMLFLFMLMFSSYHQIMKVQYTDSMQSEMECATLCYTTTATDWNALVQAAYGFGTLTILFAITVLLFEHLTFSLIGQNTTAILTQLYYRCHRFLYQLFSFIHQLFSSGIIQPRFYA